LENESNEFNIETIFLISKCLINITHKINSITKNVKVLLSPKNTDQKLQIDIHILGNLSALGKHLEVLLLLSRHSFFKRKSTRIQNLLPRVIGIISRVIYYALSNVGKLFFNKRFPSTQRPLATYP
jgi:hypothetical protein